MPKPRKPTKFLNTKLIERFLRDYKKMPYKSKSALMAAVLIIFLIPLALLYPFNQPNPTLLDLAPLQPVTCHITGCANQLCLDQPIDTPTATCNPDPSYQCLNHAVCELQKSGHCGWTQTPEYLNCLSNLP